MNVRLGGTSWCCLLLHSSIDMRETLCTLRLNKIFSVNYKLFCNGGVHQSGSQVKYVGFCIFLLTENIEWSQLCSVVYQIKESEIAKFSTKDFSCDLIQMFFQWSLCNNRWLMNGCFYEDDPSQTGNWINSEIQNLFKASEFPSCFYFGRRQAWSVLRFISSTCRKCALYTTVNHAVTP